MVFFRFIYIVTCASILHFYLLLNSIPLCVYTTICLPIYLVDRHLGCFHLLSITNNPPVHFYPKICTFRGLGLTLLPPPPVINPILPWKLASWVCEWCSHTGPELRRALCSVVAVLKFLISFEQEAPYFHFALGLTNYIADSAFWAVWAEPWKYYFHVPQTPVIYRGFGFLCPRV